MAHDFESLSTDRATAHFAFSGERSGIWHRGGYGQSGLYSANDLAMFPEFIAPVTAEPLFWVGADESDLRDSGYKQLVRQCPNGEQRGLIVVSDKYDLAQSIDDLRTLSVHLFGDLDAARWETAGGLQGFKRFFASAPLTMAGEVGPGDELNSRLVFDTGYGRARKLRVTTVRPVCANTLSAGALAANASAFAGRHIGLSSEMLKEAATELREASAVFDNFLVEARAMRRVELLAGSTVGTVGDFMRAVAGAEGDAASAEAKKLALDLEIALYRQPGWDGSSSAWQALNAVTWGVDHGGVLDAGGNKNKAQTGLSSVIAGTWLDGKGSGLKDRALAEAKRLVGTAGVVA